MSKILIIEDDLIMVKLLTTALENDHFTVVAAYDGLQGTTLAHNERPDLIVLDLIMPLGGGITALRNLKMSTHTNMIPIIVISSTSDNCLIEEVKNMDIEIFITKPFNANDLLLKIKEILPE